MPDFNGNTLIITLDSGVTSVDVETDLYSDWKEWFKISDNAKYPNAFRTSGGDPLQPGIDAGAYFFLQNDAGWRIKPPEENISVLLTGNLAPEDASADLIIPTDGAFTTSVVGLQPITQSVSTLLQIQQDTSYQGAVYINTFTGLPGTTYPCGTATEPVDNLQDAMTIATRINVQKLVLTGIIVLDRPFFFWEIDGQTGVSSVFLNGKDVSGTKFFGVGVQGEAVTSIAPVVLHSGQVGELGVQNWNGSIAQSLIAGDITFAANSSMLECASGVLTSGGPDLSLEGLGIRVHCTGYSGALTVSSVANTDAVISIDAHAGHVTVNPSCTEGDVDVHGLVFLTNNANGAHIEVDGHVQPKKIMTTSKFIALS